MTNERMIFPRVYSPWRRFFARSFDFSLYTTLWQLLAIALGWNITIDSLGMDLLWTALGVLTMLGLEPLFLARWGTTPGKALWGLSVTAQDGSQLTYAEAFRRTQSVLWKGEGLYIPLYTLYRNYKSYGACTAGELLPWEEESVLHQRDKAFWRPLLWLGAEVVLIAVLVLTTLAAAPPHNKGEITVAEFCENFNDLAAYHRADLAYLLAPDGSWTDNRDPNTIYISDPRWVPDFVFTEENGVMTGLTCTLEEDWDGYFLGGYQMYYAMAMLAFVEAQEEYTMPLLHNPLEDLLEVASIYSDLGIDETLYGVRIRWETDVDPDQGYAKEFFSLEKVTH